MHNFGIVYMCVLVFILLSSFENWKTKFVDEKIWPVASRCVIVRPKDATFGYISENMNFEWERGWKLIKSPETWYFWEKSLPWLKQFYITSPKVSFFEREMSISNTFQKILVMSLKRVERLIRSLKNRYFMKNTTLKIDLWPILTFLGSLFIMLWLA